MFGEQPAFASDASCGWGPRSCVIGKVPNRPNLVHYGLLEEPERVFSAWLEHAVVIAGNVLPNRAVRFVVAPRQMPMIGVWVPSRDIAGRSFPLVFLKRLSECAVESSEPRALRSLRDLPWTLLLAGCAHYLTAAESCLLLGRTDSLSDVWCKLDGLSLPSAQDLTDLCSEAKAELARERLDSFANRNLSEAASGEELTNALRRLAPVPVGEAGRIAKQPAMLSLPAKNEFDVFAWLELLRVQRNPESTPRALFWCPSDRRALVSLDAPLSGTVAFLRQPRGECVQALPVTGEPDDCVPFDLELRRLIRASETLGQLRSALAGESSEEEREVKTVEPLGCAARGKRGAARADGAASRADDRNEIEDASCEPVVAKPNQTLTLAPEEARGVWAAEGASIVAAECSASAEVERVATTAAVQAEGSRIRASSPDAARESFQRSPSERVQRDRAMREQALRHRDAYERSLRERAERERAVRERAEHERAMYESAMRERAYRERAMRENAVRERAEHERAVRENAMRECEERERAERQAAEREQANRENAVRAEREWAEREQANREKAARAERERGERELAARNFVADRQQTSRRAGSVRITQSQLIGDPPADRRAASARGNSVRISTVVTLVDDAATAAARELCREPRNAEALDARVAPTRGTAPSEVCREPCNAERMDAHLAFSRAAAFCEHCGEPRDVESMDARFAPSPTEPVTTPDNTVDFIAARERARYVAARAAECGLDMLYELNAAEPRARAVPRADGAPRARAVPRADGAPRARAVPHADDSRRAHAARSSFDHCEHHLPNQHAHDFSHRSASAPGASSECRPQPPAFDHRSSKFSQHPPTAQLDPSSLQSEPHAFDQRSADFSDHPPTAPIDPSSLADADRNPSSFASAAAPRARRSPSPFISTDSWLALDIPPEARAFMPPPLASRAGR